MKYVYSNSFFRFRWRNSFLPKRVEGCCRYIPDPPVEGIKEVIERLISDGLCVVICSSRAESFEGQTAIAEWLKHYGFPMVQIQARKVPSIVHVDDRAICFDGRANNLYEQIVNFKPWYERESENENH